MTTPTGRHCKTFVNVHDSDKTIFKCPDATGNGEYKCFFKKDCYANDSHVCDSAKTAQVAFECSDVEIARYLHGKDSVKHGQVFANNFLDMLQFSIKPTYPPFCNQLKK